MQLVAEMNTGRSSLVVPPKQSEKST